MKNLRDAKFLIQKAKDIIKYKDSINILKDKIELDNVDYTKFTYQYLTWDTANPFFLNKFSTFFSNIFLFVTDPQVTTTINGNESVTFNACCSKVFSQQGPYIVPITENVIYEWSLPDGTVLTGDTITLTSNVILDFLQQGYTEIYVLARNITGTVRSRPVPVPLEDFRNILIYFAPYPDDICNYQPPTNVISVCSVSVQRLPLLQPQGAFTSYSSFLPDKTNDLNKEYLPGIGQYATVTLRFTYQDNTTDDITFLGFWKPEFLTLLETHDCTNPLTHDSSCQATGCSPIYVDMTPTLNKPYFGYKCNDNIYVISYGDPLYFTYTYFIHHIPTDTMYFCSQTGMLAENSIYGYTVHTDPTSSFPTVNMFSLYTDDNSVFDFVNNTFPVTPNMYSISIVSNFDDVNESLTLRYYPSYPIIMRNGIGFSGCGYCTIDSNSNLIVKPYYKYDATLDEYLPLTGIGISCDTSKLFFMCPVNNNNALQTNIVIADVDPITKDITFIEMFENVFNTNWYVNNTIAGFSSYKNGVHYLLSFYRYFRNKGFIYYTYDEVTKTLNTYRIKSDTGYVSLTWNTTLYSYETMIDNYLFLSDGEYIYIVDMDQNLMLHKVSAMTLWFYPPLQTYPIKLYKDNNDNIICEVVMWDEVDTLITYFMILVLDPNTGSLTISEYDSFIMPNVTYDINVPQELISTRQAVPFDQNITQQQGQYTIPPSYTNVTCTVF